MPEIEVWFIVLMTAGLIAREVVHHKRARLSPLTGEVHLIWRDLERFDQNAKIIRKNQRVADEIFERVVAEQEYDFLSEYDLVDDIATAIVTRKAIEAISQEEET